MVIYKNTSLDSMIFVFNIIEFLQMQTDGRKVLTEPNCSNFQQFLHLLCDIRILQMPKRQITLIIIYSNQTDGMELDNNIALLQRKNQTEAEMPK